MQIMPQALSLKIGNKYGWQCLLCPKQVKQSGNYVKMGEDIKFLEGGIIQTSLDRYLLLFLAHKYLKQIYSMHVYILLLTMQNFILQVNCIAPLFLSRAMLPLLEKAAGSKPDSQGRSVHRSAIIQVYKFTLQKYLHMQYFIMYISKFLYMFH